VVVAKKEAEKVLQFLVLHRNESGIREVVFGEKKSISPDLKL